MDWSHARGFPRLNYIIIISASRQRARKTQSRDLFQTVRRRSNPVGPGRPKGV